MGNMHHEIQGASNDEEREYWLSTGGLLAVLWDSVSYRRLLEDKRLCKSLLLWFVVRTCPINDLVLISQAQHVLAQDPEDRCALNVDIARGFCRLVFNIVLVVAL